MSRTSSRRQLSGCGVVCGKESPPTLWSRARKRETCASESAGLSPRTAPALVLLSNCILTDIVRVLASALPYSFAVVNLRLQVTTTKNLDATNRLALAIVAQHNTGGPASEPCRGPALSTFGHRRRTHEPCTPIHVLAETTTRSRALGPNAHCPELPALPPSFTRILKLLVLLMHCIFLASFYTLQYVTQNLQNLTHPVPSKSCSNTGQTLSCSPSSCDGGIPAS
jgi:hypothetical protein